MTCLSDWSFRLCTTNGYHRLTLKTCNKRVLTHGMLIITIVHKGLMCSRRCSRRDSPLRNIVVAAILTLGDMAFYSLTLAIAAPVHLHGASNFHSCPQLRLTWILSSGSCHFAFYLLRYTSYLHPTSYLRPLVSCLLHSERRTNLPSNFRALWKPALHDSHNFRTWDRHLPSPKTI